MAKKCDKRGKIELGKKSEEAAATWLRGRGYIVLVRNFRCRFGEIDIVARKGDVMHVVEVRSRKVGNAGVDKVEGEIVQAISRVKLRRIRMTAMVFMNSHGYGSIDVNVLIAAVSWYNPRRFRVRIVSVW